MLLHLFHFNDGSSVADRLHLAGLIYCGAFPTLICVYQFSLFGGLHVYRSHDLSMFDRRLWRIKRQLDDVAPFDRLAPLDRHHLTEMISLIELRVALQYELAQRPEVELVVFNFWFGLLLGGFILTPLHNTFPVLVLENCLVTDGGNPLCAENVAFSDNLSRLQLL